MHVTVSGPRGGRVDKQHEVYTIAAIKFFAKHLNINRKKISIHVNIYKAIHHMDFDAELHFDDREFVINVCLYNDWLPSVAHEMVHVKQVVRGELTHDTVVTDADGDDAYNNDPCEIEATSLQYDMVRAFTAKRYYKH